MTTQNLPSPDPLDWPNGPSESVGEDMDAEFHQTPVVFDDGTEEGESKYWPGAYHHSPECQYLGYGEWDCYCD